MRRIILRLRPLFLAAVLVSCATVQPVARLASPAPAGTVAAANPLAVEAGLEILRRGGSAVDAAVAVQSMLGLVEPQSSGIGGGAFLMHYDAQTGRITAFNGREKAPTGAAPGMFLNEQGEPLPLQQAIWSGRSTGVPGAVAMLDAAHRRFGKLPWEALFDPAIRAASEGFTVTPRLAGFVRSWTRPPGTDAHTMLARADGSPLQAGDTFRNPDYARTLTRIAREGPDALYRGGIAAAIVSRTGQPPLAGTMSLQDLATYQPEISDPVCGIYRAYRVCVPPPPSSGVSLLQLLAILDRTDIAARGPQDPQAWFLFAEASRIMYADRDRYIADPRFVAVPTGGLLDPGYVRQRAALIGDRAGPEPTAGRPPPGVARGADASVEVAGTSHFVVVDAEGDVVSMTTTVESVFGSGRVVGGFLLNNQLTDFSLRPTDEQGVAVANAVAGGKRPRSSMSPVIVLDGDGRFVAALGSPGGNAILAYNAKALVGLLGWNLSMQQAIDLPNVVARGDQFRGEAEKFPAGVLQGLKERGVTLEPSRAEASGLHGLGRLPGGGIEGGVDPRREGIVGSVATVH